MISQAYAVTMARYNRWQNGSLCAAADTLAETERRRERGAFFGSIEGTFNHLLWADRMWMHRFAGHPRPEGGIRESSRLMPDWASLKAARAEMDAVILEWAEELDDDWLAGDLVWYSGAWGRELSRPRALVTLHFFNHQAHHRGQIHAMLTAAGAKPEDTDLIVMPGLPDL